MGIQVSVVMAAYNGERYLDESLSGLLNQTLGDFECIIVNDGSTDRTPELLDRWQRREARLTVIHQNHQGLTRSLNQAIRLAQAPYLARQDADDLSQPDRLERQVRYLDAHPPVAAVGCAASIIDAQGRVLGRLPARRVTNVRRGLETLKAIPAHSSVMMRKAAWEAVGGYREAFPVTQDLDLWLRLSERDGFALLDEPLVAWRANPEGVYATRRMMQLQYVGLALAFARERRLYGTDSYEQLLAADGNLDAFVSTYRLRGLLHALWGELLFRGLQDPGMARPHFRQALRHGFLHPKALCWFGWTHLGLAWPGRRPLSVSAVR